MYIFCNTIVIVFILLQYYEVLCNEDERSSWGEQSSKSSEGGKKYGPFETSQKFPTDSISDVHLLMKKFPIVPEIKQTTKQLDIDCLESSESPKEEFQNTHTNPSLNPKNENYEPVTSHEEVPSTPEGAKDLNSQWNTNRGTQSFDSKQVIPDEVIRRVENTNFRSNFGESDPSVARRNNESERDNSDLVNSIFPNDDNLFSHSNSRNEILIKGTQPLTNLNDGDEEDLVLQPIEYCKNSMILGFPSVLHIDYSVDDDNDDYTLMLRMNAGNELNTTIKPEESTEPNKPNIVEPKTYLNNTWDDEQQCPPHKQCVPRCREGFLYVKNNKKCQRNRCGINQILNTTGQCICAPGFVFYTLNGTCVKRCLPGYTFNVRIGQCALGQMAAEKVLRSVGSNAG